MKITKDLGLWAEKYRPSTIEDVILSQKYKNYFNEVMKKGELPHLILAGQQGIGKTSLAKSLVNSLKRDSIYINASLDNSIDTIRYNVSHFAKSKSIYGNKKIVILDEADRLQAAQDALKVLLEEVSKTCSFIFITNNIHKIIAPLKSRCQVIEFEYKKEEKNEVAKQLFERLEFILNNENIKYDKKVLKELIKKLFPDFRKIINTLQQFYLQYGEITNKILDFVSYDTVLIEIIKNLKEKKFKELRELARNIEPDNFYRFFYNKLNNYIEENSKPEIILILSKYAYQHSLTIDPEINLVACLVEIMNKARWKK
jgi:replication factor C small subunit